MSIEIPTKESFLHGCKEYANHGKRDPMYKVATFLVQHFWGKPADMADALGVLLLTWNQAFYRYGPIDFDALESCIAGNLKRIEEYRGREIESMSSSDEEEIQDLFLGFMQALKIDSGKKSLVSAAKALHLLAPSFFPLWDEKIAKAYGCYYDVSPSRQYVKFCRIIKAIAPAAKGFGFESTRTLVKLIDEYNYSKYTKRWTN